MRTGSGARRAFSEAESAGLNSVGLPGTRTAGRGGTETAFEGGLLGGGENRFGGEELSGADGGRGGQVGVGRDVTAIDPVPLAEIDNQRLGGGNLSRRGRLPVQVPDKT